MSDSPQLEAQYCAHKYHLLPVVLTRGEGVFHLDRLATLRYSYRK